VCGQQRDQRLPLIALSDGSGEEGREEGSKERKKEGKIRRKDLYCTRAALGTAHWRLD
jgi:hypothetical protein